VAPAGQVLVSETTRAAAGRMRDVDYGQRELHWLRNVTEPIGSYRVQVNESSGGGVRARIACVLGRTVRTSEAMA
jgi:class 3 adenylate cyclase